ncbi:hypothetical protein KIPB_015135 [Kipferlia bialata]|uniref:Uncharacterized protein n=1 Tax=Kipferlia bialata TaxID=797122 RepID=A0A391NU52_9EUKA|nr:hypothetical protein KIPB_015135 [Kipferlia bialata]|eukprot:g15135.t1
MSRMKQPSLPAVDPGKAESAAMIRRGEEKAAKLREKERLRRVKRDTALVPPTYTSASARPRKGEEGHENGDNPTVVNKRVTRNRPVRQGIRERLGQVVSTRQSGLTESRAAKRAHEVAKEKKKKIEREKKSKKKVCTRQQPYLYA